MVFSEIEMNVHRLVEVQNLTLQNVHSFRKFLLEHVLVLLPKIKNYKYSLFKKNYLLKYI